MKPAKILKIAFNMVKANKLRSWLTIIGVIIGIASVMTIITTGEYFQEQVTKTLEGLGGDTITIVASTPFNVNQEEEVEIRQRFGREFRKKFGREFRRKFDNSSERFRNFRRRFRNSLEVTAETADESETNTSDSIELEACNRSRTNKDGCFYSPENSSC